MIYSRVARYLCLALMLFVAKSDFVSDQGVPVTFESDSEGNVLAILVYGDRDFETIKIPCDDSKYTGPGVIQCHLTTSGAYALHIPFQFVRDDNGVIVDVTFDDEKSVQDIHVPLRPTYNVDGEIVGVIFGDVDAQIIQVPFRPEFNGEGEIVGVVYDGDIRTTQQGKMSKSGLFVYAMMGIGLFAIVFLLWINYRCKNKVGAAGGSAGGDEKGAFPPIADDETDGEESQADAELAVTY